MEVNNQWIKEEIKKEIKKYLETIKKMETQHTKIYRMQHKQF